MRTDIDSAGVTTSLLSSSGPALRRVYRKSLTKTDAGPLGEPVRVSKSRQQPCRLASDHHLAGDPAPYTATSRSVLSYCSLRRRTLRMQKEPPSAPPVPPACSRQHARRLTRTKPPARDPRTNLDAYLVLANATSVDLRHPHPRIIRSKIREWVGGEGKKGKTCF